MVLLTLIMTLWVLYAPESLGALPPIEKNVIRQKTWESLTHCDWYRTYLWSQRFSEVDRDSKLLLQLSIIQGLFVKNQARQTKSNLVPFIFTSPSEMEIWKDESFYEKNDSACRSALKSRINFIHLPYDLLSQYTQESLSRYFQLRNESRRVVREFLLSLFIYPAKSHFKDRLLEKHHFQSFPENNAAYSSEEEFCHWQIVKLLSQRSPPTLDKYHKFYDACSGLPKVGFFRVLWARIAVGFGDMLLYIGQPEHAFYLYQEAAQNFETPQVPTAIHYRLALSLFENPNSIDDEMGMRLSYLLNHSSDLENIFKNIIVNRFCRSFEKFSSYETLRLVRKVFAEEKTVKSIVELFEKCTHGGEKKVLSLLKHLSTSSQDQSFQAVELQEQILRLSILGQDFHQAKKSAKQLAKLAHFLPQQAKSAFWRSIARSKFSHGKTQAMSIFFEYQRAAPKVHWLEYDNTRKSLFFAKLNLMKSGSQVTEHEVLPDHMAALKTLQLKYQYLPALPEASEQVSLVEIDWVQSYYHDWKEASLKP